MSSHKGERKDSRLLPFNSNPVTSLRVAMAVEYNGSAYCGWQTQKKPAVATVQSELEKALSRVAGQSVKVYCAGRTDSGVHASGQIIHFEPGVERSEKAWVMGANSNLPRDIAVQWARPVSDDFHARFSALTRTYRYIICNKPVKPALAYYQLTWVKEPLDCELMDREAQCLLGEHDFSSYRGAGCQSRSPFRNVHSISCTRRGDIVTIEITANAFLLHMVRNIAGVLIAVGRATAPSGWAKAVLEAKDRTAGGVTAAPNGLYLVAVEYPERFALPRQPKGPYICANSDV